MESGVMPVYDMNKSDGDGMYGGAFIWVIMLFFLLAWGGGGLFGGNNDSSALTRADMTSEFNFNNLDNSVRSLQGGLADSTYALNNTIANGFTGTQRDMCTGFNAVNANINQSRFDMQSCCCETNRNIDTLRYQSQQNTCDIMQNADRNTQRILDYMCQNEMQTLRDNLQDARYQLNQQAQSAALISTIRPTPIPAYVTCSPYEAVTTCSCSTTSK